MFSIKKTRTVKYIFKKIEIIRIGDYEFDTKGITLPEYRKYKAMYEKIVYIMMQKHYAFYYMLQDEKYVTEGAVLECTCGKDTATIQLPLDHGVDAPNGRALLTCGDCEAGVNIPTFGVCEYDETKFGKIYPRSNKVTEDGETKCFPILGTRWIQRKFLPVSLKTEEGKYEGALGESSVLVCLYGGVISIVGDSDGEDEAVEAPEEPEGTDKAAETPDEDAISEEINEKPETIELSSWLTAYKGEPTRGGGTEIDLKTDARNALGEENYKRTKKYGIDWYSYEEGLNQNVETQYKNAGRIPPKEYDPSSGHRFVNEKDRYWVAVGPEVLYPGYNKAYPGTKGTLNESQFKYGTELDVVLEHMTSGERVYIECIVGDVKAHTWPDGVFQTGEPYPESASKDEDGSEHRNGSYIEFQHRPINENGKYINGIMSKYKVVNIIVYGRDW